MLKKILLILVCVSLATTAYANSAKNTMYEFPYVEGVEKQGVVAEFDENNRLLSFSTCDIEIGKDICKAGLGSIKSENLRIYFPNTETTVKDIKPIEDITAKPEENPPAAYPTPIDSATAFMQVKSVNEVVEEDEIKIKLTVFFRGTEQEILISDEETIVSSPLATDITGSGLQALKKGDIIYCSTNLSGKIRTVELIHRPLNVDYVCSEENYGLNFEKLFSDGQNVTTVNPVPVAVYGGRNTQRHQYAFGLVKEAEEGYITLVNKSGSEMIIDVSDNTVVYVYDGSKKRDNMYIGNKLDIEASFIPSEFMDEDGNITSWEEESIHNYALVRTGDNEALDIAMFMDGMY